MCCPRCAVECDEREATRWRHHGGPAGRLYVRTLVQRSPHVDIALLPEDGNRGIGRMLMEGTLAEGRSTGMRLTIHVERNNPARGVYDRLGFQHVDTNGVYHLMEWSPGRSHSRQSAVCSRQS